MAGQMLASAGVAQAQSKVAYKPTKRGGGGPLKTLWWQGATLLNPHFAVGTKDQDGSRIFYEPLASWDPDGNLAPVLAAEIPSVQNGGRGQGRQVGDLEAQEGRDLARRQALHRRRLRLHLGVRRPTPPPRPSTSAPTRTSRSTKVDSHTIRVTFQKPTPFWADAFCGVRGMIIPKHLFEAFKGAKSREAPTNLKPVGTGPYKFADFKPGDMVRGELNPNYHMPNRPYFDTIEMKGGGDAVSAARAVIQTGEFDYAWNMQVEDEILKRLEQGGKGKADIVTGGNIEHIQLNYTDPWKEVDGERSSLKTKHPFLTDPAVRQALNLLVDRASVQEQIYGRTGIATANFLNAPAALRLEEHQVGVQRRQGQPDPRGGGLEEGRGRHPRQGRHEAQDGLPDLDQCPAPEDAGRSSSRPRPRRASRWS